MSRTLTQKGVNAQREILSPDANITQDLRDLRTSSPFPNFCRAVVVDVVFDPTSLTKEQVEALRSSVSNPELVDSVPRNSIVARIVSNAKDRRDSKPIVCYPMLPQHLSLPVKPGEQVWVMFEKPDESIRQGFWLCRITEPDHVDDVNFTHADRKYSSMSSQTTSQKAKSRESTSEIIKPEFNNGTGRDSQTLQGAGDYDAIAKSALASAAFETAPVPRFTKRPGDTVIQGSNNAMIVMGEDRTGPASERPAGGGLAGTVDIVVGRGRWLAGDGETPTGNAPLVIVNSRGNSEVDKNPRVNGRLPNTKEGEPSLTEDAARVYVSMQTDGDINFQTGPDFLPEPFGAFSDESGAFVAARADHIRLVTRSDSERSIDGTVRIVRQGLTVKESASLTLDRGGAVQLDGNVIYIGRTGGAGPGPGGSEPYIRFSYFKSLMDGILDDIAKFTKSLAKSFAANTTPGFGAPCPQLTLAAANECADLLVAIEQRREQIDTVMSERIYGE